jgi:cell division protein FtsX
MFSSLITDDVRSMFARKKKQLRLVTGIIAGLLFVLNVFLWFSLYAQEFSWSIREKLGMYFYIVDDADQQDAVYAKVTQLSKRLQDAWLETVFASKDEAFGFLQNRIPNVIENFNRFGINNPLPATLYVMFGSDQEYQALKNIIVDYRSIISNVADLDQANTLKKQENRVVTMIGFSRFAVMLGYILVWFLLLVILTVCGYMLHTLYVDFHGKIDVKKLLGASLQQTIMPFLVMTGWVVGMAYVVAWCMLIVSGIVISSYLDMLFQTTVWSIIGSYGLSFWLLMLVQILLVVGLSIWFAYSYVRALIRHES